MAATKKPPRGGPTKGEPSRDVFRVVVRAPDRQSLQRLLLEHRPDRGPARPKPGTEEVEVDLFVTKKQIDELEKDGWKLEVHENLTKIGKERQKEVGKGDRFQGGKKPPKGLGKKTGKER